MSHYKCKIYKNHQVDLYKHPICAIIYVFQIQEISLCTLFYFFLRNPEIEQKSEVVPLYAVDVTTNDTVIRQGYVLQEMTIFDANTIITIIQLQKVHVWNTNKPWYKVRNCRVDKPFD